VRICYPISALFSRQIAQVVGDHVLQDHVRVLYSPVVILGEQ